MRQVFHFLFLLAGSLYLQTAYGSSFPGEREADPPSVFASNAGLKAACLSAEPLLPEKDTILPEANPVTPKKDSLNEDKGLTKDTTLIKEDTIPPASKTVSHIKDSVIRKKKDPRRATIYSAILPGAGQVYNRKYWKVPLVYAAIGIPAYFYFYNKSWYKKCQYALAVTVNGSQGDSLAKVEPVLRPFVSSGDVNGIITNRDTFRKNQDYSVLFFLLFYGLNIVDATVDAHLKDFNVNDDLSFKVKPMLIPGPSLVTGVSLVFDIHKARPRPLNMN